MNNNVNEIVIGFITFLQTKPWRLSWLVLPLTFPLWPAPLPSTRSDEKLELQWNLEGHQLGVVSVDISHDGAIAASSSLDAHIRLWDLDSGKQIKSMDAGPGKTLRRAPGFWEGYSWFWLFVCFVLSCFCFIYFYLFFSPMSGFLKNVWWLYAL